MSYSDHVTIVGVSLSVGTLVAETTAGLNVGQAWGISREVS